MTTKIKSTKKSTKKEEKEVLKESEKSSDKKPARKSTLSVAGESRLKTVEKVLPQQPKVKQEKYYEAVGKRKSAIARIRLFTQGEKIVTVNAKPVDVYFPTLELQQIATASLRKMKSLDRFRIEVKVAGGGLRGQAEAMRLGAARVLVLFNADYRKRLRKAGYLTRDARVKERKKFGLKKARRAPQWAKR